MTGVSLRQRGREYLALPGGRRRPARRPHRRPAAARAVGEPARRRGGTAPPASTVDLRGLPLHTDDNGLPDPRPPRRLARGGGHPVRGNGHGGARRRVRSIVDAPAFPFPHRIEVAIAAHDDRLVVDTTSCPPAAGGCRWRSAGTRTSACRARPARSGACACPPAATSRSTAGASRPAPSEAERAEAEPVGRRHFDDLYALGRSRRLAFAADDGTADRAARRARPTRTRRCGCRRAGRSPRSSRWPHRPTRSGAATTPLVAPGDAFTARFELRPTA